MDETSTYVTTKNLTSLQHERAAGAHRARRTYGWENLPHRVGRGRPEDAQLMLDICDNIEGKSFCPLGDAAAWPIQSAIKQFPDDFKKWLQAKTDIYASNV